jgi:hypothetical protein
MKTTKKKTGPKRHFARYVGGLASVRHSGRLARGTPFMFMGRSWVEIPKDPTWMCKECNHRYIKGLERVGGQITTRTSVREKTVDMLPDKNGKPHYCGAMRTAMAPIFDGVRQGTVPEVRTCESARFTDTVQRRFFKSKADSNPTWEYKTE